MSWGYGYEYEAMWWMLLTMILYSVVGVIVLGALVWIVIWAVTRWRFGRQGQVKENEDDDLSAPDIRPVASNDGSAGVASGETSGQNHVPKRPDELTQSRW